MNLKKPKFWDFKKPNYLSNLLLPLSKLVEIYSTIKKPKVGLIVGSGIRAYDAGEIWHLFDTRYKITITKIDIKNINRINLDEYSHVILPSYSGGNLTSKKIEDFLNRGGSLIAYRSSINWLEKNKIISVDFIKNERYASNVSFEDRGKFSGSQVVGGAIFDTKIDKSQKRNFGTNKKLKICQNNVFDEILNQNYFLKTKFELSEPSGTPKH